MKATTRSVKKKVAKKKTVVGKKRWSAGITRNSNALDLKSKVSPSGDPHKIAASLKIYAKKNTRKKGTPVGRLQKEAGSKK